MFRLAAPRVPTSGIVGALHIANPPDACSPLVKPTGERANTAASFVLVQRGQCNFETKVRISQEAGYKAVIVYNDQDDHELITSTFLYIVLSVNVVALPMSLNLLNVLQSLLCCIPSVSQASFGQM